MRNGNIQEELSLTNEINFFNKTYNKIFVSSNNAYDALGTKAFRRKFCEIYFII